MGSTNKRSLVVGASGQVGNQIAQALGFDRTVRTVRGNPGANEIVVDLLELADNTGLARRLVDHDVDAVYCAAAMTHVDGCETAPDAAMKANCHAPAALAAAAAEARVPFVFFSTEYVFDGKNGPYDEEAKANPISVYGRSKWMGELEVRKACPRALILRTTVVYGVDPARKNFLYSLRRACLEKRPFRSPDDQISTPTYNRDLAQAAIRLATAGQTGIFNVSGPERLNRYDFAIAAIRAMGLEHDNLSAITTAELKQIAPRPLNAGLVIGKLARTLPDLRMRGTEEGVSEWMALDPAVPST
jgi:dTDP-4-dehydrorhamnose reductase